MGLDRKAGAHTLDTPLWRLHKPFQVPIKPPDSLNKGGVHLEKMVAHSCPLGTLPWECLLVVEMIEGCELTGKCKRHLARLFGTDDILCYSTEIGVTTGFPADSESTVSMFGTMDTQSMGNVQKIGSLANTLIRLNVVQQRRLVMCREKEEMSMTFTPVVIAILECWPNLSQSSMTAVVGQNGCNTLKYCMSVGSTIAKGAYTDPSDR